MTDQPITEAELAEWEKLYGEAHRAPWRFQVFSGDYPMVLVGSDGPAVAHPVSTTKSAELIAAQRQFGPRLIAEVRRLKGVLNNVRRVALKHEDCKGEVGTNQVMEALGDD